MLLDLANACCCFLFRFAFAMCLIANAFKARSCICLRMHAIESPSVNGITRRKKEMLTSQLINAD